eukprot:614222_1
MNRHPHFMSDEQKEIKRVQESLPVYREKQNIVDKVKNNSITLVVGQTGSGKTTQIPQYLLEWNEVTPSKKIVCTQPRTLAAQEVARRVAEEQGQKVGEKVGYHIRLDRQGQDGVTKLEYMTEGVLLRKAMNCDNLSDYKVVIIDEAHERTVNADLLMGFLKKMVKQREDLRVIIMSATLDTERFLAYFDNPPLIDVPGSTNPVQHHWCSEPTENYMDLAIQTILAIHANCATKDEQSGQYIPDGHILVFLTGQKDIDSVVNDVKKNRNVRNQYGHTLEIVPLYSKLSNDDRRKAFDEPHNPHTMRKCVVATNIAETSLTIDNVVYVIDCGLSKQKIYSPSKGVEVLGVRGISKASVMQRVGRAGRVKPGVAYHLYTRNGYGDFPNETPPEILRSGLVDEILSMLALGIDNPLKFDFIDAPDEMTMARALHILKNLNAIDKNCRITGIGRKMSRFPVNPRLSKSLVMAEKYGCCYEIIVIAAMLEVEDCLWYKPRAADKKLARFKQRQKEFYHASGDHLTLLNVYNAYSAVKKQNRNLKNWCRDNFLKHKLLDRVDGIKRQIENILADAIADDSKQMDQPVVFKVSDIQHPQYYENIIKALLSGHFMNIAVAGFGDNYWRFRLLDVGNHERAVDIIDKAKVHQNSIFHKNKAKNWVIFNDVSITHTTQLKILTAIKPQWLKEIDSNDYYDVDALKKDKTPIARILIDA